MVKNVLRSLFLLIAICSVAKATDITVQSTTIPNWQNPQAAPRLRIYLSKPVVTSDSQVLQSGSPQSGVAYQTITCSVASGVLTIPAIHLQSLNDAAVGSDAYYSAYFYTSTGQQIIDYRGFTRFVVPAAPTLTTWAAIAIYNSSPIAARPPTTYTKEQINALLASAGNSIASFLLNTPDSTLENSFALSTLATGLLKNTTGTGIPSIAVSGVDYLAPSALTSLNASNLTSGTIPDARFPSVLPALSGLNLTNLNASNLASGTLPDARFPSVLPALSGLNLTNLNASNLASGTLPDARFPSTLPALSGVNLTNLNASNLASGTLPDARFPATLPVLSGANLTNLNASNLASGTVPDGRLSGNVSLLGSSIDLSGAEATGTLAAGRFPALTGDITTSAGSLATTLATTIPNPHTFTGAITFISSTANEAAWANKGASPYLFGGAHSVADSSTPGVGGELSFAIQTTRSGGAQGNATVIGGISANQTGKNDLYLLYGLGKITGDYSAVSSGSINIHGGRFYVLGNPSAIGGANIHLYPIWAQGEFMVGGLLTQAIQADTNNSSGSDAPSSVITPGRSVNLAFGHGPGHHNTVDMLSEALPSNSSFRGWDVRPNAYPQVILNFTEATFEPQGTINVTQFSGNVTGVTGIAAQSVTSLTSSSGTATANVTGHGFSTGNRITIAGATPDSYNGVYVITVTNVNQFTYSFAGGTSPATGTITATRVGTKFTTEYSVGDPLNILGVYYTVATITDPNNMTIAPVYAATSATNLVITKATPPLWMANQSFIMAQNAAGNAKYRAFGLLASNVWSFDPDARGVILGGDATVSGLLKAGTSPTTLTDAAGKILSAALNTVAVANGGSGAITLTGLLQGNGTGAFTAISNSSTVGQVLRVTGSATYSWGALDLADSDAITGTLPPGNGGTGIASYTVGDLLYASGTTTLSKLADVAVGSVLISGGVGTAPAWSAAPTLTTSLTVPNLFGGTSAGSTLTLTGTSNVSPASAHILMNTIGAAGTQIGVVSIGAPSTKFATGDILHLQQADGQVGLITIDTYAAVAGIAMRSATNTAASPNATTSGQQVGSFGGRGYQDTTEAFATTNNAAFVFTAAENFTSTAQGMHIDFQTTPKGTASRAQRWRIDAEGWFIGKELSANPTTTELTAGDHAALYVKNDKFVIAYNQGGTIKYIVFTLDGSTTTFTNSTTAP
jgi:hypothetical protein